MKVTFDFNSQPFTVDLSSTGRSFRAIVGDATAIVEILRSDTERGQLTFTIGDESVTAHISSDNARRWVTINGQTFVLTKASGARKSGGGHHHAAGELTAPMPGQVRAVNVSEGDTVTKGQTLLVLEAMKMEIRIQSPADGRAGRVWVKQGQTVEREQVLIEIE